MPFTNNHMIKVQMLSLNFLYHTLYGDSAWGGVYLAFHGNRSKSFFEDVNSELSFCALGINVCPSLCVGMLAMFHVPSSNPMLPFLVVIHSLVTMTLLYIICLSRMQKSSRVLGLPC